MPTSWAEKDEEDIAILDTSRSQMPDTIQRDIYIFFNFYFFQTNSSNFSWELCAGAENYLGGLDCRLTVLKTVFNTCAACFCVSVAGSRERSYARLAEDYTKPACSERGNGKDVIKQSDWAVPRYSLLVKSSCRYSHLKALFRCITFHHTAGDVWINLYVIM